MQRGRLHKYRPGNICRGGTPWPPVSTTMRVSHNGRPRSAAHKDAHYITVTKKATPVSDELGTEAAFEIWK